MRVSLFVTCLVDQLWPSVGVAAVEVLRRAGCDVRFDARQTCCGQPAFNSGWHDEARRVATSLLEVYDDDRCDAVVLPSGSCASMFHHFEDLFAGDAGMQAKARALTGRTHELASFLVDVLGVTDVGARFDGLVTWHDACHGLRELGIAAQPRALLAKVAGCELVEVQGHDSCCGFGGTFAVKQPELSVAMADAKLEAIEASGVDAVVSGDVSCLMQLGGRLARRGSTVRTLHLAELLAGTPGGHA
jgi:L-lactate dehydrogenase complex protein LldE